MATAAMKKHTPSHPMPLPGAPPPDDPDNPTNLPVDPDDGGVPAPDEDEGEDWAPPA